MPLVIRKANLEDVLQFIETIDPMDIDELMASDPNRILEEELVGYLNDDALVCVDEEDFVYSYGGITETEEGAMVWFLTSIALRDAGKKVQQDYIKLMSQWRADTVAKYGCIFNFIWDGNENHKKFIKRMGGVFHDIYRHSQYTNERFQLFTIGGKLNV